MLDVVIIGGGPCGLAIALGLLNAAPHLQVKVYERARELLPRGAGMALLNNGKAALKAIDDRTFQRVEEIIKVPKDRVVFGSDGTHTVVPNVPDTYGNLSAFISWSDLQAQLYHSFTEKGGEVEFGHVFEKFTFIDEGHSGGYEVTFRGREARVQARLLIGCDGYFSRVRQQWLGDGPPAYTGTVLWRGRIPLDVCPPFWHDTTTMVFLKNKVVNVYPGSKDSVCWAAGAPESFLKQSGLQPLEFPGSSTTLAPDTKNPGDKNGSVPEEDRLFSTQAQGMYNAKALEVHDDSSGSSSAKSRCLAVFADYPEVLVELFKATPDSAMVEHLNCYRPSETLPSQRFGEGPITIAGDAAHVIRPTGQGVNQALEDAAVLCASIAEQGLTEAAVRQYEAIRLPRVKKFALASELGAAQSYLSDNDPQKAVMVEKMRQTEDELMAQGVQFRDLRSLAREPALVT